MKKYVYSIRKHIFAEIFFALLFTICMSMLPVLQKRLFDGIYEITMLSLFRLAVIYLSLHFGCSLFEYLSMVYTWKGAIAFENMMKTDFFRAVFRMRQEDFYRHPIGDYISLQANDITALEQDWLQPSVDLIRSAIMIVTYTITIVCFINWRIAVILIFLSCISVAISFYSGLLLQKKRNAYQEQLAKYTATITDLLEGFSLINSKTVTRISERHTDRLCDMSKVRLAYGKGKSRSLALNDFSLRLVQVIAFAVAGFFFINGMISLGTAVASFGYVTSFVEPINSILYDVNTIKSVQGVKNKFLTYSRMPAKQAKSLTLHRPSIELLDASAQAGDFLLHPINRTFEAGKKYALTGANGAGKSVLLKLITGAISANEGQVLLGGEDVTTLDTSELIAYIAQNEHVFSDGFYENATLWNSYSKDLLDRKIRLFPDGMFSKLFGYQSGDNAQNMSWGEKQMMFFLRMLIRECPVIILDEPFSAMNPMTTSAFDQMIFSDMLKDRLIIMVTHNNDPAYLSRFDEVLEMRDGVVTVRQS